MKKSIIGKRAKVLECIDGKHIGMIGKITYVSFNGDVEIKNKYDTCWTSKYKLLPTKKRKKKEQICKCGHHRTLHHYSSMVHDWTKCNLCSCLKFSPIKKEKKLRITTMTRQNDLIYGNTANGKTYKLEKDKWVEVTPVKSPIEKIEIKDFHDPFTHFTHEGYEGNPVTLAKKINQIIDYLTSQEKNND